MFRSLILAASFSLCIIFILGQGCDYEGIKMKVGESYSVPGKCMSVICGESGHIHEIGCPEYILHPDYDCVIQPVDYSKPLPACCEYPNCTRKETTTAHKG